MHPNNSHLKRLFKPTSKIGIKRNVDDAEILRKTIGVIAFFFTNLVFEPSERII